MIIALVSTFLSFYFLFPKISLLVCDPAHRAGGIFPSNFDCILPLGLFIIAITGLLALTIIFRLLKQFEFKRLLVSGVAVITSVATFIDHYGDYIILSVIILCFFIFLFTYTALVKCKNLRTIIITHTVIIVVWALLIQFLVNSRFLGL